MLRTTKDMETLCTLYEQYNVLRIRLQLPQPNTVVWFTPVDGTRCIDVTHDGIGTFQVSLYKGNNPTDRRYYKVADFYLNEEAAIDQAIQWYRTADDADISDESEER